MPRNARRKRGGPSESKQSKRQRSGRKGGVIDLGSPQLPSDFEIQVGRLLLKTHRLILLMSGDVFRTMLAEDAKCSELDLSVDVGKLCGVDVCEDDWASFAKCLYPATSQNTADLITNDNALAIAALAKKYDIPAVLGMCDNTAKSMDIGQLDVPQLLDEFHVRSELGLKASAAKCLGKLLPKIITSQHPLSFSQCGHDYSHVPELRFTQDGSRWLQMKLNKFSKPTLVALMKEIIDYLQ